MSHESSTSTSDQVPNSNHSSDHALTSSTSQAAARIEPDSDGEQIKAAYEKYREEFLDHLIRQLDIMIYCELSTLYYMDCSLLSFVARAMNHWFYFTPKPPVMSAAITWSRPHIVIIFGINLLSSFLHTIYTPPTAGEATRGYLQGGLLIDFVGQLSPVSRVRLVAYDLLILALQMVMLGVTLEKRKLIDAGNSSAEGGESREDERQDHDFEERGVRRGEIVEGIELQPLRPLSGGRTGGDEDGERDELLGENESTPVEHPGDAFYSGQYVVTDVHIVDTVRSQWRHSYTAARSSNDRSVGAATELARQRLRFRIRIGGREYGS
ncbi:MAG: hypothetical protein Q9181_001339 [Wetmoreana brouardii]